MSDTASPDEHVDMLAIDDPLLSMILDRTSDGVMVATRDGVIRYANGPLGELFGYQPDELVGQRVEMLIPHDHRRTHRAHVEKFAKEPHPRPMGRPDLDIEGRRKDGSRFAVDVQLNPMPEVGLVVATVRDMTDQRRQTAAHAITALDLAQARRDNELLANALDLIVQRLFGLGMAISAGAGTDTVATIDAIIAEVHDVRRTTGTRATTPTRR